MSSGRLQGSADLSSISIRNIQACREFLSLSEPNWLIYAREQDLRCSGEKQFCSFVYEFEIKEVRKSTWRWEQAREGVVYRIVNKILCSEGGEASFKGVFI